MKAKIKKAPPGALGWLMIGRIVEVTHVWEIEAGALFRLKVGAQSFYATDENLIII